MGYISRLEMDYIRTPFTAEQVNDRLTTFAQAITNKDTQILSTLVDNEDTALLLKYFGTSLYSYTFLEDDDSPGEVYLDCEGKGKYYETDALAIFISTICMDTVRLTFSGEDGTFWGYSISPGRVENLQVIPVGIMALSKPAPEVKKALEESIPEGGGVSPDPELFAQLAVIANEVERKLKETAKSYMTRKYVNVDLKIAFFNITEQSKKNSRVSYSTTCYYRVNCKNLYDGSRFFSSLIEEERYKITKPIKILRPFLKESKRLLPTASTRYEPHYSYYNLDSESRTLKDYAKYLVSQLSNSASADTPLRLEGFAKLLKTLPDIFLHDLKFDTTAARVMKEKHDIISGVLETL